MARGATSHAREKREKDAKRRERQKHAARASRGRADARRRRALSEGGTAKEALRGAESSRDGVGAPPPSESDESTRAQIERDFAHARQDWSLVRCENCGLEQGTGPYPCAVCGHELAAYAEED